MAAQGQHESSQHSRLPAPIRLRSAGAGVTVAGIALLALSPVLQFPQAGAVLVGTGIAVGVVGRDQDVAVQFGLGVGALGVIALLEGLTAGGLGIDVATLGVVALVFGVLDVVVGTTLARIAASND